MDPALTVALSGRKTLSLSGVKSAAALVSFRIKGDPALDLAFDDSGEKLRTSVWNLGSAAEKQSRLLFDSPGSKPKPLNYKNERHQNHTG